MELKTLEGLERVAAVRLAGLAAYSDLLPQTRDAEEHWKHERRINQNTATGVLAEARKESKVESAAASDSTAARSP